MIELFSLNTVSQKFDSFWFGNLEVILEYFEIRGDCVSVVFNTEYKKISFFNKDNDLIGYFYQ